MRRLLSERTIVAILFVIALVVFVFAQEEARKVERKYMYEETGVSSIMPSPSKTAVLQQDSVSK